jgi:hypothetical protein
MQEVAIIDKKESAYKTILIKQFETLLNGASAYYHFFYILMLFTIYMFL